MAVAAVAALAISGPVAARSTPMTGRIEGIVHLVASNGAPIASGAYPSRRVSRQAPAAHEIANVIVFLRDVPASTGLSTTRARMVQREESFVPRVLAITRGSTVEFPNSDPFFHNVFSLSRGANFDLGRFPSGESRTRTFTQAGLVKVYCHIHSHMSASIMVFDHPHFTTPAADGRFVLDDVPVGTFRVSAWHERIGESAKPVTISAGQTTRAEFALPVEDR